ncbi:MAG: TonB-dependent receptor [Prevotellaceae bacterium]|jgi:TonB-linked SusC/RagA family outer membrane protein|nr:TonB-dependent receptor [Prevotellaceae bacterium]
MTKNLKKRKKRIILLALALLGICPALSAQGNPVSGKVTDVNNEPLIGVNIVVKSTANGAVTDFDGNYSLKNVKEDDVLVFSYLGYEKKERKAGKETVINIVLNESVTLLDQVVVVGYGQQKKINLTGAVASVHVDEALAGRSIANVSSALQGLMPGLNVTQRSGMAGNNSAELMIRGVGTINDASPLIVVDDMPDVDINRISIDDIESISVLKDATASSVYGSRAANGVILVKTKSGKGQNKTKITFSGNYGWDSPIKSYSYMENYPRALQVHRTSQQVTDMNENSQRYKRGTIEQWLALGMIDEKRYPNTDWWDVFMRTGGIRNYNVAASGGTEKANFYASIGYMKQEGLQINNDYDRYNVRLNFDYKVFDNVNIGTKIDGNWSNYTYAQTNGFSGSNNDMQNAIAGIYPYDPVLDVYGGVMAVNEDDTAYNPLIFLENSKRKKDRQELNGSLYLNWSPVKGLVAQIDYGLRYYNQFEKVANIPARHYNFQTETYGRWYFNEKEGISNASDTGYKTLLNTRLNYNTKIAEEHDLGALFVYSEEYWFDRKLSAGRQERIHPSLSEIEAALTSNNTNGGNSSAEGLRSYTGRLNYAAYNKYLLELNFRIDGSSKFQPGHQYGFFPSAAVAWRFSEEQFIKQYTEQWFSSGKFRFSYGSLGNNKSIGRSQQQEILEQSNYMLDGEIAKGFVYKKMLNQDLTWEVTTVLNTGLDFVFFNGKFSTELDYYDRLTTDMMQDSKLSIHLTGAYEAPKANIGSMRNRGLEGNFTWRDKIRDFNYSANFNISYNQSRVEKWSEFLARGYEYGSKRIFIDMPYDYVYTYLDNGKIIQSYPETMDAFFLQGVAPGDIARLDINGDGRVDGNDKVVVQGFNRDRPTTTFALGLQGAWKGFDLSMLFQGAYGRKDYWLNSFKTLNIPASRYASTWDHITEPWSWDNRDGSWPRLGGITTNQTETEYWLDDMSYLRMKNLMLGYTLPARWTKKAGIDNFRIYASTENLFTLTKFRGLDPEKPDKGDMYPLTKSVSIGVNIGF